GTAVVAAAAFSTWGIAVAPAASADPIDNVDGGASGVSATVNLGLVTVNLPPTSSVTLPSGGGNVSQSLAQVNVPGVVSTGVLNTPTEGALDPGGFSHSTASVADPTVLSGLATADVISSECTSGQAGSAGTSTLVDANLLGTPLLNISPPPNTTLGIPGVVTITLNGQSGSTTPDATQLAVRAPQANVVHGT